MTPSVYYYTLHTEHYTHSNMKSTVSMYVYVCTAIVRGEPHYSQMP